MIYLHPIGGLGNMFFQIASIWTLAKDNCDDLYLLNVEDNIIHLIKDKNRKQAVKYEYFFNRFSVKNDYIDNKLQYPFYYIPLIYKTEYEYLGYFQCEKYFKHRRIEILELFKPTEKINSEINKYKNLFSNISVHVRRGDYVNAIVNVTQPIEYYRNALAQLPNDLKVLIFSDDLKWCKENFIGDRYVFIDEIDYISIYLMSKMKYHVIANSSFSWWSAWMSEYDDKIIITPKMWFGKNTVYDGDLIPENWIRI
jgi:hypothetical protein